MNSYEKGGLNFLDFATLNNTFKVNWLRQIIRNPNSIWNFIPSYIFSTLGGLQFFLGCNYDIDKIPVKLAEFHRQAFLSWSLIFKHNFSPHRYYIWNNKDIVYKRKSLFLEYWFKNGIILVDQLFNSNGFLFTFGEFLAYYKIPVTPKDYAKVFDAISPKICTLFKYTTRINTTLWSLPNIVNTYEGRICLSFNSHNSCIRTLFQRNIVSLPYVHSFWNRFSDDIVWKKVWLLPNQYLITNKIKEVSFKLIHRIYPTKHFLVKFKSDIDTNCTFCNNSLETMVHLYWYCPHVKPFWENVCEFICKNIDADFMLFWKYVLFGIFKNQRDYHDTNNIYIINLILLLAKFHIHKCKFSGKKPCFILFKKEMELYIDSIRFSLKQKALKTLKMCTLFNIIL